MRAAWRKAVARFGYEHCVELHQERGVYNFYVKPRTPGAAGGGAGSAASPASQRARDLCPQEAVQPQQQQQQLLQPGGRRQGRNL